jgi:hypothetical protein
MVMENKTFTKQFYANRPLDSKAATAAEIQSSIIQIFDPLVPVVSHQLQSLQARPGMTEEQAEDCGELGWSLAPPPIRQVS